MSEVSKFEAYKKKLQGLCDEHEFVFRLRHNTYPITLTISPCGGAGEQLSMLADAEDNAYMSPDAKLVFFMKDGELGYKISENFTISDALFGRFKNLFKNLHSCWLQYFFRSTIENGSLKAGTMPVIDEDMAEDNEAEDAALITDLEPDAEDEAEETMSVDEYLIRQATTLVRAENKATASLLQRRLNIGYSRAGRLMDELEARGIIGPYNGSAPREVLPCDIPDDDYEGSANNG